MVFITMIFQCLSFVMMITLLRLYSIFPILWIWWMTENSTPKVFYKNSFFFYCCQEENFSFYAVIRNHFAIAGNLLVGPALAPIEKKYWRVESFSEEQKREHDTKRKKYWLFNAITSFLYHATILIIIVVLWETTSVLDQNLSPCTFPVIKDYISIICGIIVALGMLSCLMPYVYYKY